MSYERLTSNSFAGRDSKNLEDASRLLALMDETTIACGEPVARTDAIAGLDRGRNVNAERAGPPSMRLQSSTTSRFLVRLRVRASRNSVD